MRKILLLSFLGLFSMQAYSQDIPEYCLENDVVHRYLTEVQYDPNDYSYSKIRDYCYNYPWDWEHEGKGVRLDFPKPVPIKLEKALDDVATLYVSEYADYSDAAKKVMNISKGVDSINVWNLIPGRTYNWKVAKKDGTIVQSGKFKTTGTLRMLKVDNVFNVRDMGGWEGLKGYSLRYGVIIRGSRLNVNSSSTLMITESGIEELRWAGMRAELDMRDASNSLNASYAYFSKNNDSPLYSVNSAYNSRIATFANAPQSIIGVKKLIEWLKQGKHVYLHCSVGADRTGTVAYLVGALCGMSEDALCKEFELTSFSGDKIDNEADRGNYERLIRQRSKVGRLDPCSSPESYRFADMVDKIKSFQKTEHPEWTLQQRVYYHLNTGAKGDGTFLSEKIPAADLDFLINYMLNPIELNLSGTVNMNRGESKQLKARMTSTSSENPNAVITFTSSNTDIATVSEDGLVKAVGSGTATIKASVDGFEKSFTVKIPVVESELPDTIFSGDYYYSPKGNNYIKNGSFEYLNGFDKWKNGKDEALADDAFDLKKYDANAFDVYIESKADGDAESANSIHAKWTILKKRTYVFGYRVKNSTNKQSDKNPYLVTGLVNSSDTLKLEYPTYNGEWTDVQYVFENTEYSTIHVWFSHLSQDGNNTCFDNFYLVELSEPTYVAPIQAAPVRMISDDKIYNLAGMEVTNPGKGIYIRNGKKYIIK